MKSIIQTIFVFCLLAFSLKTFSQDTTKKNEIITAYFTTQHDTIFRMAQGAEIAKVVTLKILGSEKVKGTRIMVSIDEQRTNFPLDKVFLNRTSFVAADSTETKTVSIKAPRNDSLDYTLALKIAAEAPEGKDIKLKDSAITYMLLIRPMSSLGLSRTKTDTAEFWVYTGTNFDFLDGVRTEDLYFKGSLLTNLFTESNYLYVTFGKNRFNSDKDSLYRVSFREDIPTAVPGDSMTIAQGIYNVFRVVETSNLFASVDFLQELASVKGSTLLASAGFYFGLQTVKTKYSDYRFLSDTSKILRQKDSTYIFRPVLKEDRYKQANYNFSLGILHILDLNNLNVKTQITVGLNVLDYPRSRVRNSIAEFTQYERSKNIFTQLRIDATVLDPGISLGLECFLRSSQLPLFNVSLTKVIDFRNIATLFAPLNPINVHAGN